MPLSLALGRSSFGFGVHPLRGSLMAGRTAQYSARKFLHPSVPNGSFVIDSAGGSLSIFGADGNQSGFVAAATLIDGTGQKFLSSFQLFTEGDSYFWALVKNTANECRLVRATFSGTVVTPGAKFLPTTPAYFGDGLFVFEAGATLSVRYASANAFYEHVINKANGQLVTQNNYTANLCSGGPYRSQDGDITFSHLSNISNEDKYILHGLSFLGSRIPNITISYLEAFGVANPAGGIFTPVMSGDFILFMPAESYSTTVGIQMVLRTEFDRWLRDITKRFSFV